MGWEGVEREVRQKCFRRRTRMAVFGHEKEIAGQYELSKRGPVRPNPHNPLFLGLMEARVFIYAKFVRSYQIATRAKGMNGKRC